MTEIIETARCEMADGIVSYIYQEMALTDRLAFEEHLLTCTACIDKFAEVADARFSVYEWRRVEFEALPTPQIVIPYNPPVQVSWYARLRGAFSFAPAWATVGLPSVAAAVLLAIGLAGYQSHSSGDVAVNLGIAEAVEPAAAERAVAPEEPVEIETTEIVETPQNQETSATPVPVSIRKRPARAEQPRPVRTNRTTVTKRQRTRPDQAVRQNTPQVPLPIFSEYAEQEDETLRLAELFDDIETRD